MSDICKHCGHDHEAWGAVAAKCDKKVVAQLRTELAAAEEELVAEKIELENCNRLLENLVVHTQCPPKTTLRKWFSVLEAGNKQLREALEKNVRRCDCGAIGKHQYEDEDGQEWKCDKHRKEKFYRHYAGIFEPSALAEQALK